MLCMCFKPILLLGKEKGKTVLYIVEICDNVFKVKNRNTTRIMQSFELMSDIEDLLEVTAGELT